MTPGKVAFRVPGMAKARKVTAGERPRRYALGGDCLEAPPAEAGLYLVATPIGNLRDISLRALEILAAADVIACEDSRVTRKLTQHYGIATPQTPYHEHNAAEARPKILARLGIGQVVALVSDAGTPLISDPGYRLVREAVEAGFTVIPVPGASAVLTALAAAGLPTDRFFFEGFLPPKQVGRQKRIVELSVIPATLVLFESGPRLAASLADLAAGFGARQAAVCRELTKLHEEIRRDDLDKLARHYQAGAETRGEIVIVVAPPSDDTYSADDVDDLLRRALARVSVREAVGEVALATGRPRREVYQRALELSKDNGEGAP
jgi:16S rRNA (cytidine1402-2'-O)-methyltransferase